MASKLADSSDLQTVVVVSVLALGTLGTGVGYILNYRLIRNEGATTASTVTYLLPIVAVALGAAVLGETITWNLLAGTAIVLLGVGLSEKGRTATHPPVERTPTRRPRTVR